MYSEAKAANPHKSKKKTIGEKRNQSLIEEKSLKNEQPGKAAGQGEFVICKRGGRGAGILGQRRQTGSTKVNLE